MKKPSLSLLKKQADKSKNIKIIFKYFFSLKLLLCNNLIIAKIIILNKIKNFDKHNIFDNIKLSSE